MCAVCLLACVGEDAALTVSGRVYVVMARLGIAFRDHFGDERSKRCDNRCIRVIVVEVRCIKKRCALASANEAEVKAGKSNSKANKTCVGGRGARVSSDFRSPIRASAREQTV